MQYVKTILLHFVWKCSSATESFVSAQHGNVAEEPTQYERRREDERQYKYIRTELEPKQNYKNKKNVKRALKKLNQNNLVCLWNCSHANPTTYIIQRARIRTYEHTHTHLIAYCRVDDMKCI